MSWRIFSSTLAMVILTASSGCAKDAGGLSATMTAPSTAPSLTDAMADEPRFVTGSVVDVELVPIGGADVVVNPGDHVQVTNDLGLFKIGPLEPGPYTVTAQKSGYEGADMAVEVFEDRPSKVTLKISPKASTVPYHVSVPKAGYLMCHMVVNPPLNLNAPCVATLEAVQPFPRGYLPDRWMIPFSIADPGFTSLVLEMTWDAQQLGKNGVLQLTKAAAAETPTSNPGSVRIGNTYFGDEQASPFYAVLHAGKSYWETDDKPVVFYPTPNATEDFVLLFAGGGNNNSVPVGAVFIEFRAEIWLSFFHNRLALPGFTALKDE